MPESDRSAASELVAALLASGRVLVLAESCTAGLAAAMIGGVPGASKVFAGSSVVYQINSKIAWLGIDESMIAKFTAESMGVTRAIAQGVLKSTPHADLALAITGHLGPDAPPEQDGVVYLALVRRGDSNVPTQRMTLASQQRIDRQREAATRLLEFGTDWLVANP